MSGKGYSTDTAEVKALRERVAELERDMEEQGEVILDAEGARLGAVKELQQCHQAITEAVELTYRYGPTAGIERVAQIDVDRHPDIPYDWLSRWKVELA